MSEPRGALPVGAVRVPWIAGTRAAASPPAPRGKPSRAARCGKKAVRVREDLQVLRDFLADRALEGPRRERLEAEIALQERRVEWLTAAAAADRGVLASRQLRIERDLGEEGLGYLVHGLPEERKRDQRFVELLAELAIVRFALGGE